MKEQIFCPRCKSTDVRKEITALLVIGAPQNWICNNCGYSGIIFPIIKKIKQKTKQK